MCTLLENYLYNEIDAMCDGATELLKQGKYREAIGDYDKVLLLDPDDHTAPLLQGFLTLSAWGVP